MEDVQAQGGIVDKAVLVTLAQGRAGQGSPEWAVTGGDVATAVWQLPVLLNGLGATNHAGIRWVALVPDVTVTMCRWL